MLRSWSEVATNRVSPTPGQRRARERSGAPRLPSIPVRLFAVMAFALLAVSLAISAATLGQENFWIDELSSLYFSDPTYSLREIATRIWPLETNPPLYYFLLYLWRHVIPGTDEISIRAASLLLAVLACLSPLLYPSRVMRLERRLAVMALLSCSPGLLYFAGEARGYTLLVLFSVNLCFRLLSAIRTLRTGAGNLGVEVALLSLLSVAAAWTHFFGIVLAASAFPILVVAALVLRRSIGLVVAAAALTALAVTIWPLSQWSYIHEITGDHWFLSLSGESMLAATKWFAHLAFGGQWSVLVAGALSLAALAWTWNPRVSNKELLLALLALFFAWVIGLSLYVPIFDARYFVVALPPIYMLVAEATGDAAERLSARPALLQLALVLPLAASFATRWPAVEPPDREDWRAPAEVVNETPGCAGAPIFVLAHPRDNGDPAFLYGHYLDASRGVRLTPVDVSKPIDAATLQEVWNSACAVKFWAAHVLPWKLTYLAEDFAAFPPGFRLVPFRGGFLMLAGGSDPVAKR